MKLRTIRIILFLSCNIALFPVEKWQTGTELQKELEEKHKLTVFPLANTEKPIDYTFTGKNTIIRTKIDENEFLAEYNLKTQETRIIPPPEKLKKKKIIQSSELYYDDTSNTVHTQIEISGAGSQNTTEYYLFHLNNGTWEEIPELQNIAHRYAYNPNTSNLYFNTKNNNEGILVFDMKNREFANTADIIDPSLRIFAVYGEPLQMLCGIWIRKEQFYYRFNTETEQGKIFPKIKFRTDDIPLWHYTHIENQRFLCVNLTKQNNYQIVELNLEAGTKKILVIETLSRKIDTLKKVDETHYSFLVESDDNHKLLCIMEYR